MASVLLSGTPAAVSVPINAPSINTVNITCANVLATGGVGANSLSATTSVSAATVTATGAISGATVSSAGAVTGTQGAFTGAVSAGGDALITGLIYDPGANVAEVTITELGKPVGQAPGSSVQVNQLLQVNGPIGLGTVYDTVNLPATAYLALPGNPGGVINVNPPGFGNPPELVATYPIPANLQTAQMYEFRLSLTGDFTIGSGGDGQEWAFYITNTVGAAPDGSTTQQILHYEVGTASPFTLPGAISPCLVTTTGVPNSSYFKGGLLSIIYDGNPTDGNLYLYVVALNASTGGGNIPNLVTTALITAYNV